MYRSRTSSSSILGHPTSTSVPSSSTYVDNRRPLCALLGRRPLCALLGRRSWATLVVPPAPWLVVCAVGALCERDEERGGKARQQALHVQLARTRAGDERPAIRKSRRMQRLSPERVWEDCGEEQPQSRCPRSCRLQHCWHHRTPRRGQCQWLAPAGARASLVCLSPFGFECSVCPVKGRTLAHECVSRRRSHRQRAGRRGECPL